MHLRITVQPKSVKPTFMRKSIQLHVALKYCMHKHSIYYLGIAFYAVNYMKLF